MERLRRWWNNLILQDFYDRVNESAIFHLLFRARIWIGDRWWNITHPRLWLEWRKTLRSWKNDPLFRVYPRSYRWIWDDHDFGGDESTGHVEAFYGIDADDHWGAYAPERNELAAQMASRGALSVMWVGDYHVWLVPKRKRRAR